jgi:aldose 1-epimerase
MKLFTRTLALPYLLAAFLTGAFAMTVQAQDVTEIGGEKIVTLTRKAVSTARPEFTSVTVLPGRGMEVLQITANFPGKGNIDVLASPDLAESKKMLTSRTLPTAISATG